MFEERHKTKKPVVAAKGQIQEGASKKSTVGKAEDLAKAAEEDITDQLFANEI